MEVQTGGSDTLNGGLFDTASTGKPTDLTTDANTANTSAPIVSSATYNFVAQDVGNWLYVQAGTNWIPGWYKITAVGSNKATLNAAIGAAVLANFTANTAVGCATVGTPTAGTWSVDYSQQGGVQFSLTGITTAAANAILLSASFTKAMVGNGVQITGGTNFTVGFYQINAVTAGVSATVDRTATSAAGLAGTAGIGGALASPGQMAAITVAKNRAWIKTGTYTITSASTNIAGGCILTSGKDGTNAAGLTWTEGYGTLRGDLGTRPTLILQAGLTTPVVWDMGNHTGEMLRNIIIDCNSVASSTGISRCGPACIVESCKVQNATTGFNPSNASAFARLYKCEANACTTGFLATSNNGAFLFVCYAHNCTGSGFAVNSGTGNLLLDCISYSNTVDGFVVSGSAGRCVVNCVAYGNTGAGFNFTNDALGSAAINCISWGNTGVGFNSTGVIAGAFLWNCAGGGNSSNYSTTNITNVYSFVTLTSDPFISASGGNFALTPAAIALLAGVPGSFPGLASTTGFLFIGAVQPARSGPMGAPIIAMAGDLALVE